MCFGYWLALSGALWCASYVSDVRMTSASMLCLVVCPGAGGGEGRANVWRMCGAVLFCCPLGQF